MPRKPRATSDSALLTATAATMTTNDEAEGRQGKARRGDGRTSGATIERQTSGELIVLDDGGDRLGIVTLQIADAQVVPLPFQHPNSDLCGLVDATVAAYLQQESENLPGQLRVGLRVQTPDGPGTLVAPYFWAGGHNGAWWVQRDDLRPPADREIANGWTYLSFCPRHQISPEST